MVLLFIYVLSFMTKKIVHTPVKMSKQWASDISGDMENGG